MEIRLNIYQQLIALIESINPSSSLSISDICSLDQDIAFLNEVPNLLANPNASQNLLANSQKVFYIAKRWLGSSDNLNSWLQAYTNNV